MVIGMPAHGLGARPAAREQIDGLTETEVREALEQLDPLWDELFPPEQARIVQLFMERVEVNVDGVDIKLRVDGLEGLYREVAGIGDRVRKAA